MQRTRLAKRMFSLQLAQVCSSYTLSLSSSVPRRCLLSLEMAAPTVSDILLEMSDAQDLMVTRLSDAVKKNSIAALAKKIEKLGSMDSSSALKLCRALDESYFDEGVKTVIQLAIDARLASGLQASASSTMKQQHLAHTVNYLTAGDWAVIMNPRAVPAQMIQVMATRLSKLQIRSLHEQTVKWPVAIVLHCVQQNTGRFPRYQTICDWVQDFKRQFESYKSDIPENPIIHYPVDPSGLPEELYEAAYDSADPPIAKVLPGFNALGAHIPLRSNSALLVRERNQAASHPHGYSAPMPMGMYRMAPNMPGSSGGPDHGYAEHGYPPHHGFIPGMGYTRPNPKAEPFSAEPEAAPLQNSNADERQVPQPLLRFAPGAPRVPVPKFEPELAAAAKVEPSAAKVEPSAAKVEPSAAKVEHSAAGVALGPAKLEDEAFAALKARPIKKKPAAKTPGVKSESKNDDEDEHDEEEGEESESSQGDSEESESSSSDEPPAMKAMKTSSSMKAMKASGSPKTTMIKKPAAVWVTGSKKSGQKPIVHAQVTPADLKRTTSKHLSSLWYFRARSAMKQAGFNEAAGKVYARKIHASVLDQWTTLEKKGKKAKKA